MSAFQALQQRLRGSIQQHLAVLLAAARWPVPSAQVGHAVDSLQMLHGMPADGRDTFRSRLWPQQHLQATQCRAWHSHTSPCAALQPMAACLSQTLPAALAKLSHSAWRVHVAGSPWQQWQALHGQQVRHSGNLSRVRVPKSAAINDTPMGNKTDLHYGIYGIRALTGQRVAANTIEAMRRTLRRKLKKTVALWVRIEATVPVTRKPLGIRMGKGKGHIEFYACAVRPGQIICEMDRVPKTVALAALEALQPKFPCRLGFVEWS